MLLRWDLEKSGREGFAFAAWSRFLFPRSLMTGPFQSFGIALKLMTVRPSARVRPPAQACFEPSLAAYAVTR